MAASTVAKQKPTLDIVSKITTPASTIVTASLASLASLFGMVNGLPATLLISLIASSVGFISAVYFVGYGYGLSMVAMGALALRHYSTAAAISQLGLFHACMVIMWGTRIFSFLLFRELVAWPGLRARTKETNKKFSPSARVSTWLFVAVFYCLLFSPALFHLQEASALPVVSQAGLAVSGLGLLLEAQSDQDKSTFKKSQADNFMSSGLYKLCRHPNYLGELIFWSGSFITGLGSLTTPLKWSVASVGLAGIFAIMLQATMSLERKQALKYGERQDYKDYVKRTPMLVPFMGGDDLNVILAEAKEALAKKGKKSTPPSDKVSTSATPTTASQASPAASTEAQGMVPPNNDTGLSAPPQENYKSSNTSQSNYAKNKKPWDV